MRKKGVTDEFEVASHACSMRTYLGSPARPRRWLVRLRHLRRWRCDAQHDGKDRGPRLSAVGWPKIEPAFALRATASNPWWSLPKLMRKPLDKYRHAYGWPLQGRDDPGFFQVGGKS